MREQNDEHGNEIVVFDVMLSQTAVTYVDWTVSINGIDILTRLN